MQQPCVHSPNSCGEPGSPQSKQQQLVQRQSRHTLQGRLLITMYAFLRTVPACWGCSRAKGEGRGKRVRRAAAMHAAPPPPSIVRSAAGCDAPPSPAHLQPSQSAHVSQTGAGIRAAHIVRRKERASVRKRTGASRVARSERQQNHQQRAAACWDAEFTSRSAHRVRGPRGQTSAAAQRAEDSLLGWRYRRRALLPLLDG